MSKKIETEVLETEVETVETEVEETEEEKVLRESIELMTNSYDQINSLMTSEINEDNFYIINNKNRALVIKEKEYSFTDDVGSEHVVSYKTKVEAQKILDSTVKKEEIKSDKIKVVNEKEVCCYGYYVDADDNISPVYTLKTLINRATNERYHSNLIDAHLWINDADNRETKKTAKKSKSFMTKMTDKIKASKLSDDDSVLLKALLAKMS